MTDIKNDDFFDDKDMTVDIMLDCGTVTCKIVTILTVGEQDYIVLCPEKNPLCEEGDVWIYRYSENPDDPNEEPVLDYIEDDEEYEMAVDAYEEYLDDLDFDEMNDVWDDMGKDDY